MLDIEINKGFFSPVCHPTEIERIFNVKNGEDYLLKLRAETIVDHMRLFRVYRNKAIITGEDKWFLGNSFDKRHYQQFINMLPKDLKLKCKDITYGDIYADDPKGMIFPTAFGPVITISESKKFFLKFAHLAILNFKVDVPTHVRLNALRIAIRVMLKTEALDFFMDPRGIVPKTVGEAIHEPIALQMQFIAGHEFSHYLLGHLDSASIADQPIFHAFSTFEEYKNVKVYSTSQQKEFAADLHSISLPKYSEHQKAKLLKAALLWFGVLELYEAVTNIIFPNFKGIASTHPTARERFDNLLTNTPTPRGFDLSEWDGFHENIDFLKDFLQEDVSTNFEGYEFYGSVYLDEPNTRWRGKELIDRVDYY